MRTVVFKSFFILIFFCIGLVCTTYSQSNKDQIQQIQVKLDSLNKALKSEKVTNSQKFNELNSTILNLEIQITSLNSSIDKLTKELDSLKINSNNIATFQQTNIENYHSVKIGSHSWMVVNLNVSTFRNGDSIPQAKTNEEWELAGMYGKPAWCYYDNDPKNEAKYGKLYNWYAVSDPRGLAPEGWHISSDFEWVTLYNLLGSDPGLSMKSINGWWGYGCRECHGEPASRFKLKCKSCKGNYNKSKNPFSGNGINSSGFYALPGGSRVSYGNFISFGWLGCWWSSTLDESGNAITWSLCHNTYNLSRSFFDNKEEGRSVRCVKD